MKIAIASMGTVPEALVGIRFGTCSQFLVFDLDTMACVVVSVPPRQEPVERISLEAIRAVARQGVTVVITGHIKDNCRRTLLELGIEVIDGVGGMTVMEAVERYRATRMAAPESRQGTITRIAVASDGEGLDARLQTGFGRCASFTVVDPQTKQWEVVRVEPESAPHKVNLKALQAVVRSGAAVVITPELSPSCCLALQALALSAYIAPQGITVRRAVELYEQGALEEVGTIHS